MKKLLFAMALLMLMTGCASQYSHETCIQLESLKVPTHGFWVGLWHGMIAPISWLVSLFNADVAIYSIYNNGGWYDFGFVIGSGILLSRTEDAIRRNNA